MAARGRFNIGRLIGEGTFGVVYVAVEEATGNRVAVKFTCKEGTHESREVQVLKMVSGVKGCVKLRDVTYFKAEVAGKERMMQCISMPFTGITLVEYQRKNGVILPLSITKVIMLQIFEALAEIHAMGIMHRDVKPKNITVDPNSLSVRIIDFGSAKITRQDDFNTPCVGSLHYRALEMFSCNGEQSSYGQEVDNWAAGCVLYYCFRGAPPFMERSVMMQAVRILTKLGSKTEDVPFMSGTEFDFSTAPDSMRLKPLPDADAQDLLTRLLTLDPHKRITAAEAIDHPFFDI